MNNDFEMVKSSREGNVGHVIQNAVNNLDFESKGKLVEAAAENFGEIIKLADKVVDIRKIYAESDKQIAEMDAATRALQAEADAYVMKVTADSGKTLDKIEKYRLILNDFYKYNNGSMSGEVFADIMKQIILSNE